MRVRPNEFVCHQSSMFIYYSSILEVNNKASGMFEVDTKNAILILHLDSTDTTRLEYRYTQFPVDVYRYTPFPVDVHYLDTSLLIRGITM